MKLKLTILKISIKNKKTKNDLRVAPKGLITKLLNYQQLMGQFQSKVKCIYRLAQSGKTQLVKDIIDDCKRCCETFGEDDHLNFFITSNNQVLVGQTGTRFDDSYNWVSSNKKKDIHKLLWEILHNEYSMVVMCSNKARLNHLVELINMLEKSEHFTKKINIWIDEADASINLWSKFEDIALKEIVEQVTFISATFDPVFKKYKRLEVIGFKDPHPTQYRCLRDSIKIKNDFGGYVTDYIEHLFNEYPKLTESGNRAFIPGTFLKESHNDIADLLYLKYNFAVLIINGTRKEIIIPGKPAISLLEHLSYSSDGKIPEEFKGILAKMYIENKIYNYPFAITGLECVKRGITFQSNDFLFNYGIIPAISKKTEAYQLMARLFGNIGECINYKNCEIYSSSNNFKKVENQESIAMNISTIVYERDLVDVGMEELKEAANLNVDESWELIQEEFDNRIDANEFLHNSGLSRNNKETKEGEFLLSSITVKSSILYYPDVIKQLKSFSKTSTFDVKNNSIGSKNSRMYICYKDISDPTSVVFIIRIIKKIK